MNGPNEMMPRRMAVVMAALMLVAGVARAAPLVSNIRASQRTDGTYKVDVYYDLTGGSGPMRVSVVFSRDAGQSWQLTPDITHLTGDVGAAVTNGANRHIVWDAAKEWPQVYWTQCKARIYASESSSGSVFTLLLPGSVPMDFILIPRGSFKMGSPATERSRGSDESPQHNVNINYDFYMGKYEVTQAQWIAVMGSNPSYFQDDTSRPVETVSWDDIAGTGGFIPTLNAYLGGLGLGSVRLPSEAEWEYACRGGMWTRFYFGDSLGADDGTTDAPAGAWTGNRSDYMWFSFNSGSTTHPVGGKMPNGFGLFDMSGNVWEWCQDWYHTDYTGAPADGSAWQTQQSGYPYRVVRGGCWYHSAYYCRSASRSICDPGSRYNYYGFRLARTN